MFVVCVTLCVAVCCSVLLCVAVCCSVLQCVAVCCSVMQCVAVFCSVLSEIRGCQVRVCVCVRVCVLAGRNSLCSHCQMYSRNGL